jgi:exonuclease VII small subunit
MDDPIAEILHDLQQQANEGFHGDGRIQKRCNELIKQANDIMHNISVENEALRKAEEDIRKRRRLYILALAGCTILIIASVCTFGCAAAGVGVFAGVICTVGMTTTLTIDAATTGALVAAGTLTLGAGLAMTVAKAAVNELDDTLKRVEDLRDALLSVREATRGVKSPLEALHALFPALEHPIIERVHDALATTEREGLLRILHHSSFTAVIDAERIKNAQIIRKIQELMTSVDELNRYAGRLERSILEFERIK